MHCATSLREAQILLERWRHQYNTVRPLSAIRYLPPAPEIEMAAFILGHVALPESQILLSPEILITDQAQN